MERREIEVRGTVQGVGFRPFVHRLASRLGLAGFVRNRAGAVHVEVEGPADAIDAFRAALEREAPPLARIAEVRSRQIAPAGERGFRIEPSDRAIAAAAVPIPPDIAPCDACLRELEDPRDRRHGYALLNCAHCGPRLTIVRGVPYDRARTTMAAFAMCARCRAEYDDPNDRRFHAEPTACPACGPAVALLGSDGARMDGAGDPIEAAAAMLRDGRVLAVKGIGGFHLACDARSDDAVGGLRRRKARDEKPFAVLVRDLDAARALAEVSAHEAALLASPRRPIVLVARRAGAALADAVAPGSPMVGLMLPPSALHHRLARAVEGAPLVMTSGNRSDEPIAYRDDDAPERLRGLCDAILSHSRPIELRCDDSVVRVVAGVELPVRRARGYAPEPIEVASGGPRQVLAVGGHLKSTFALGRGRRVVVSHHHGDLDELGCVRAYADAIARYESLFAFRPAVLAHDLHPDYASTRYALERAEREGLPRIPVQHHHAHLAACLADNRFAGEAIGVAFDGAGLGTDGTIWGGEFLRGDASRVERVAHLRCVAMPGGERAVREPWRMAVAHLGDAGEPADAVALRYASREALRVLERLVERGVNAPRTSSVGRLFDAVAAIAGVRGAASYEAQAAIELEWLARGGRAGEGAAYAFELEGPEGPEGPMTVDARPVVRAVAREARAGADAAVIARRFHAAVVDMVARVCEHERERSGTAVVALTGGVFTNAVLLEGCTARLEARGFRVLRHQRVPANDGGLCLGQMAVAHARARAADDARSRFDAGATSGGATDVWWRADAPSEERV